MNSPREKIVNQPGVYSSAARNCRVRGETSSSYAKLSGVMRNSAMSRLLPMTKKKKCSASSNGTERNGTMEFLTDTGPSRAKPRNSLRDATIRFVTRVPSNCLSRKTFSFHSILYISGSRSKTPLSRLSIPSSRCARLAFKALILFLRHLLLIIFSSFFSVLCVHISGRSLSFARAPGENLPE